jgi:hypothetical protein
MKSKIKVKSKTENESETEIENINNKKKYISDNLKRKTNLTKFINNCGQFDNDILFNIIIGDVN